jgi:hypothetical protein
VNVELIKFLEEQEIAVTFWFRKGMTLTGVPRYKGFDIDTGELIEVNGNTIALHDFRAMLIPNINNPLYQEHHVEELLP